MDVQICALTGEVGLRAPHEGMRVLAVVRAPSPVLRRRPIVVLDPQLMALRGAATARAPDVTYA